MTAALQAAETLKHQPASEPCSPDCFHVYCQSPTCCEILCWGVEFRACSCCVQKYGMHLQTGRQALCNFADLERKQETWILPQGVWFQTLGLRELPENISTTDCRVHLLAWLAAKQVGGHFRCAVSRVLGAACFQQVLPNFAITSIARFCR